MALSRNRRAGYILLAATGVGFVVLALLVWFANPWLSSLDEATNQAVIKGRQGWLNPVILFMSSFGARYVIGPLLVGLLVWVMVTKRCRWVLIVLVAAFLLNPLLEFVLKAIISRPRPDLLRLRPGTGPSFPSGHVLASVGFYGVLAAVAWKSSLQRSVKRTAYLLATAIILGVGFARIYVGVHWLSDVVGGFLVGTAYVLVVVQALRGHHLGSPGTCWDAGPGPLRYGPRAPCGFAR
ncbi:MAG: phosphatase PAP2 family protein [Acidimicrobiia bacterium]